LAAVEFGMEKSAPLETPHDKQDEDDEEVWLDRVADNSLDAGAGSCRAGIVVGHV